MAEGTPSPFPSERHRSDESPRGERSPGPREGGFRIRLSDNEMRSARALQAAFGLRSTVAVLGFALRALGQQLEEGKLEELVALHRSQAPTRAAGEGGGRSEGRRERPEGRGGGGAGGGGTGGGGGGRWQEGRGAGARTARVDPFARPPRPEAAPEVAAEPEPEPEMEASTEAPAADLEPVISDSAPEATATEAPDTATVAPELSGETPPPVAEAAEA